MIQISKVEAAHLYKTVPGVHIRRTVHKRYAEETMAVLTQLPDNLDAQAALAELKHSGSNNYQYAN